MSLTMFNCINNFVIIMLTEIRKEFFCHVISLIALCSSLACCSSSFKISRILASSPFKARYFAYVSAACISTSYDRWYAERGAQPVINHIDPIIDKDEVFGNKAIDKISITAPAFHIFKMFCFINGLVEVFFHQI